MSNFFKKYGIVLKFVTKFLVIYFVGNLVYSLYISYYYPDADPLTVEVARQLSKLLNIYYDQTSLRIRPERPFVGLLLNDQEKLNLFEGCNGLNVAIVFFSFLLAYGPVNRSLLIFSIAGLILIHLSNLLRLSLLFWVAIELPHHFFFMHKYFFTLVIYLIVFMLWFVWIYRFRFGTDKYAAR